MIHARFYLRSPRRDCGFSSNSRVDTAVEILALRQQVAMLKRRRQRPALRQLWPRWSDALIIAKPETIVRWHRRGFRLHWRWRSQALDIENRRAMKTCVSILQPSAMKEVLTAHSHQNWPKLARLGLSRVTGGFRDQAWRAFSF